MRSTIEIRVSQANFAETLNAMRIVPHGVV